MSLVLINNQITWKDLSLIYPDGFVSPGTINTK
uniref:Uncharacterized protein n=1 Tax=Rhizophora mucronata TaxID=61149 RepID=A0A2P2PI13_RHIMU